MQGKIWKMQENAGKRRGKCEPQFIPPKEKKRGKPKAFFVDAMVWKTHCKKQGGEVCKWFTNCGLLEASWASFCLLLSQKNVCDHFT
jgi:hypothetical protein